MVEMSSVSATRPRRYKVASLGNKAGNAADELTQLRGLAPMTMVKTALGDYPAQTLRERDRVAIKGGGFVPIKSVQRMVLDEDFMRYHPGAQPICIRAGAFGIGFPQKAVMLAPYQRVAPQQRILGAQIRHARDAIGRAQVYRKAESMITYTIISLGRPAAINCSGLWVEIPA